VSRFPLLLAVHVTLAVSLLAPSLLLPFFLRRAGGEDQQSRSLRVLMAMQSSGSLWIGAGLLLTGAGLIAVLGTSLLGKPWLLVALGLYAANLAVAAFISRPNLRRLLRLGNEGDAEGWRRIARRQRYLAYAMATTVGVIGILMSVKPELW
jgi:hypothetical protein